MNGSDLKWRYKATGKATDYQLRAYAPGADPSASGEIVANVWGWDPGWNVYWYENGERRGRMSRRLGTDPLSERQHRGPELPSHRPWVDPVLSGHLFYCPAPVAKSQVKIEAVDQWGNSFVANVPQA